VSKQAAAETIAGLEQLGYVRRRVDPADARRLPVQVTPRDHELMATGTVLFDQVRARWADQIGAELLGSLEQALTQLPRRRSFTAEDVA